MTIVLQYQFWDLEVREENFEVMLSFNDKRERLFIPFAALTGFADPSVKFGLQFQSPADTPEIMEPDDFAASEGAEDDRDGKSEGDGDAPKTGGEVVSWTSSARNSNRPRRPTRHATVARRPHRRTARERSS